MFSVFNNNKLNLNGPIISTTILAVICKTNKYVLNKTNGNPLKITTTTKQKKALENNQTLVQSKEEKPLKIKMEIGLGLLDFVV